MDLALATRVDKIRPCTLEDVSWMVEIAHKRYPGHFDYKQALTWTAARLQETKMCFYRGDHAFGVAHLATRFYDPHRPQAYLTLLYSEKISTPSMEPFRVAEKLIEWARIQNATNFWFSDMTGTDMGAFAKRLGGQLTGYTYCVNLDGRENPHG